MPFSTFQHDADERAWLGSGSVLSGRCSGSDPPICDMKISRCPERDAGFDEDAQLLDLIADGFVAHSEDLGTLECDWGCRLWVKYAPRTLPGKRFVVEDKIRDILHSEEYRKEAYPYKTLEKVPDPLNPFLIPLWRYFVRDAVALGTPAYGRSRELAKITMHLQIPMKMLQTFHSRYVSRSRWSGEMSIKQVLTRDAFLYWAGKYQPEAFGDFLAFLVTLAGCNFNSSFADMSTRRYSDGFHFVLDFTDTLRLISVICLMDEARVRNLVFGYADRRGIGNVTCERMKEVVGELHASSPPFMRFGAIKAVEEACSAALGASSINEESTTHPNQSSFFPLPSMRFETFKKLVKKDRRILFPFMKLQEKLRAKSFSFGKTYWDFTLSRLSLGRAALRASLAESEKSIQEILEDEMERSLDADMDERVHHAMNEFEYEYVSAEDFLSHPSFACFVAIPNEIIEKNRRIVLKRRERELAKEYDKYRDLKELAPLETKAARCSKK